MTWNENCLKANKQLLYSKLGCMGKSSYYLFPSEYQLYTLSVKEIQFRLLSMGLFFFLRPSTKIWIANAA
jgi:hypothetical protein